MFASCRSWGSSLASVCSCWLPPPSSFWPLPSSSAANASAAKATTTHCQPNHAIRAGAESRFKDGPSFFPFHPFYVPLFLPPAFERFIFFWGWACTSPGRFGIHCSAWERHGGKSSLHLGLRRGAGSKVRLVYGPLCPCVWDIGGLGTWRKSGPLLSGPRLWVTLVWYFWRVITNKGKMKVKKCFSLVWTISCRSHRKNFYFIALFCRFVVRNKSFFFFFLPTTTLDVALLIQSVALELHHACLVSTRFAQRTWFPCHVHDWGRGGRLLSLSTRCTARPLDDVNVL